MPLIAQNKTFLFLGLIVTGSILLAASAAIQSIALAWIASTLVASAMFVKGRFSSSTFILQVKEDWQLNDRKILVGIVTGWSSIFRVSVKFCVFPFFFPQFHGIRFRKIMLTKRSRIVIIFRNIVCIVRREKQFC